jgi:calcineurin-like phosphoesterase family protein
VAEIRGFASPDAHDETIVDNWNAIVDPKDTVWVLGDVCLSQNALWKVDLLNGIKHLITGNHDAVFPGNRDSYRKQRIWRLCFESIQPFIRRRIGEHEVMLSHFPYSADRGAERYGQYRLRDEGMLLLHGHTHSAEQFTGPRELHVGLDAWRLAPVRQDNVEFSLKWMQAMP